MKLECPVCFNLLSEEPDLKFKADLDGNPPPVKKRRCSEDSTDSSSIDQQPEITALAVTKCGHLFHKLCLLNWFATTLNCPTCRKPTPDGVEELRNVFLPTPNCDDSQILLKDTVGELEIAKINLESLAEENESLKTNMRILTNATFLKDRCARKLQNDKDKMEASTDKLKERYQRLWDQYTDLRKSYDLLRMKSKGLEVEAAQLKRVDSPRGGIRGGRGRGRRGSRGRGSLNSSSSNNSIILIDLTDD